MKKKPVVSEKYMEQIHPYIPEAYSKLKQGRVTRREFLRMATLLGMSASTALIAAQCGAPAQTEAPAQSGAQPAEEKPAMEEKAEEKPAAATSSIKRGGTLRTAMLLQLIDHPARLSWIEGANIVRQVGQYLTETGADNITRPFLLESWEASEDVKTWTLNLRQGIKFNNGDELTPTLVLQC
jgi:peptide/nickel transport system substrate-binding protein